MLISSPCKITNALDHVFVSRIRQFSWNSNHKPNPSEQKKKEPTKLNLVWCQLLTQSSLPHRRFDMINWQIKINVFRFPHNNNFRYGSCREHGVMCFYQFNEITDYNSAEERSQNRNFRSESLVFHWHGINARIVVV